MLKSRSSLLLLVMLRKLARPSAQRRQLTGKLTAQR
nr:MAG TPA: hypothetical protein [Caudoviricetes sp.]